MSFLATRQASPAVPETSRTVTLVETEQPENKSSAEETVGTLRLRASPRTRTRDSQRVVWREDVVDNEGTGKKSSKICCIYHKPRPFDESSSEGSSSDSDDSDSSCNSCNHSRRRQRPNPPDPGSSGPGPSTRSRDGATVHMVHDEDHRNAYEKMPAKKANKSNKPIPQDKS